MKLNIQRPQLERISEDEVYLLDSEGNRIKRICGAKREGIPEEFPCLEEAGAGTSHPGVGKCALHDKEISISPEDINPYHKLINLDPEKDRNIIDLISLSESVSPETLTSVDPEIQALQSVISMALKNLKESNITMKKANDLSRMIERLAKLKRIKIEAAKKAQLDFEVVNKLIKGIMLSIKMHVSPEAAKRIISDIITTTINPMMSSGDITYGDVKELKKLPKKSIEEIRESLNE